VISRGPLGSEGVDETVTYEEGLMTRGVTDLYARETGLPDIVRQAVEVAVALDFHLSCHPAQGRLLQALAAGRRGGVIGETGTGCGVGLAWMLSAADAATSLISIERDTGRAAAATHLFAGCPNVSVINDEWQSLLRHGPFDLLVLDGGGSAKQPGDEPVDPRAALRPGGTIVIDDFSPRTEWPPTYAGKLDHARLHWLEHPDLLATEIQLAPSLVTVVATLR
jgi:predicted O-methyltransferase YrrM